MAWEIYIQDLPVVPRVADIPPAFIPGPIGRQALLLERLIAAVPFAERQDDWLFARTPEIDLSAQFLMEDAEQVRCIVVHVHGGEQAAACAAALVRASGQRALDTATGELFDTAAYASEAWATYCSHRMADRASGVS